MLAPTPIFEALMLICFGAAWPVAILKTIRVRRVDGKSVFFLWLVFTGYASGMGFKLTGNFNWVFFLYLLNFCMVGTEIILYYHFARLNRNAVEVTTELLSGKE